MTPLHISTQFDSGAIEVLSLANPADIQLNIRPDSANPLAQWFHFSLQGAAGLAVSLRFLNAGQCAYPKGWEGYRVVASYDRQHWFRIDTEFDGQIMSAHFTPETQSVYLAYFEPYSYERHLDQIGLAAESPAVQVQHLGQTLDGRDMTLLRITDAAAALPLAQKKKVWLIARQHPGETMAEWFAEGLVARLLDVDDAVARVLLAKCVFYVVPNMNPDGGVRGNLRTNAAGTNLNRAWAEPSLAASPEVFWVRQKMQAEGVDLCLDAHGDEGLPYNFLVGTEGTPGYSSRIEALENTFKAAWLSTCPDFQITEGYGRAVPKSANLTLATNWVGQNFDCLAFTLEMPFKDNANLPDEDTGWSGERSRHLGASALLPILAVVDQLR
ncbi:MAG: murein tripeptide amidase MpaA [Rhodoferax sp.]|jgi:murein tripeptide amidase MpaA